MHLLTCCVAKRDILCFVVDGVKGFMGLQTESGNGEEDEEERSKCHVLQSRKHRQKEEKCLHFQIRIHQLKQCCKAFFSQVIVG